ncbi:MAG: hypothetical protein GXO73_14250 [Calditrichaeota bacterium]|nr:hypothetical protein [Calditrichota bacterium]
MIHLLCDSATWVTPASTSMPAGFQNIAFASPWIVVTAEPRATMRAPTPILRNGMPLMPALRTAASLMPTIPSKAIIVKINTFRAILSSP